MRLVFRCLPEMETLLPKPRPAREGLPHWLKAMPSESKSPQLAANVRTIKQCPPFLDAMASGVLLPLACDVEIRNREFSWEWPAPPLEHARTSRAPLGVHLPEQATGAPLGQTPGQFILKFTNFWTIEAPKGWSLFFGHPHNRFDLPYRTLSGLVDCDSFKDGFVHFPALWTDPEFEGVLERGTPIAQCLPVPREALELDCRTMTDKELEAHLALQDTLQEDPGVYRKRFRAARR